MSEFPGARARNAQDFWRYLDEYRQGGTRAVAERLDGLTREYEQLYASYQDFSARLQQAGVQADLERRQLGEKFRILEPAEMATEPSSPNRILLLSLGAFFGLALGLGFVALGAESGGDRGRSVVVMATLLDCGRAFPPGRRSVAGRGSTGYPALRRRPLGWR